MGFSCFIDFYQTANLVQLDYEHSNSLGIEVNVILKTQCRTFSNKVERVSTPCHTKCGEQEQNRTNKCNDTVEVRPGALEELAFPASLVVPGSYTSEHV